MNFCGCRVKQICDFHQLLTVNCRIITNTDPVQLQPNSKIALVLKMATACQLQTRSTSTAISKATSLLHLATVILVVLQSPTTVFPSLTVEASKTH